MRALLARALARARRRRHRALAAAPPRGLEAAVGKGLAQALARLLARGARRERGEAEEALTAGAEARTGDRDDLGLLEDGRERVPRRAPLEVDVDVPAKRRAAPRRAASVPRP